MRPLLPILLAAALVASCKTTPAPNRPVPRGSAGSVVDLAKQAATLTGKVKIISDNGGGIISDNGGGIISDNGGGVISNNSGNIIANNGGGLTAAPDTYGQDVKATLALVTGGEVDAAMVYKTDAIAAGDAVETITFPEAASVINDYPIATTKDTANPDAAQAFVDLVLSADGQKVLTDAGFDPAS